MTALRLPAFAKINLDLRVFGLREDGYHELRTVFQSLALHDDVQVTAGRGPFVITCDDLTVPTDERNLVWKAAAALWRAAHGRRQGPGGATVHLRKRIPAAAGLGGGSADAAATLLALNHLWRLSLDAATLARVAASVGADVPFFLTGGTALGLGRGDEIYPLVDLPARAVAIVRPDFGVSTAEAYGWFDAALGSPGRRRRASADPGWPAWTHGFRNDLEGPVTARHRPIARLVRALAAAGATATAMSGSGSAVFALFADDQAASRALESVDGPGLTVWRTRMLPRSRYQAAYAGLLAPAAPAHRS